MHRLAILVFGLVFAAFAPLAAAQTPAADLAAPPASAETWSIVSSTGQHGTSKRWITPDGVRWSRESILLRGFVTEIDQQLRTAPDASLASIIVRGVTPTGDAAESFSAAGGRYQYQSPVDRGEGALQEGAFYSTFGGAIDSTIALTDALRAAPNNTLRLLPSGQAQLTPLTTHQLTNNGETKTLTAYAIVGVSLSPIPVWYEGDHFFASAGYLSYIPAGWESTAQELVRVQDAALATHSAELASQIGPRASQPIVFQDVRLYDSLARRFRNNMSVVVNDGRITVVGAARSVLAPANAQIIAGAGRTLVPGLWDSHQHFGSDDAGSLLLSQGITSIRDPGNRDEDLLARRHRIETGDLLGPRIVASLLIDGEGPNTSQTAAVVHNEAEGIAAVNHAHNAGYFGIKFYGTIDPAWVAPMAAEAHRLGLHVQGHIPHGMRPLDAIRAGYDEITHINFVMMQAMPQDVVDHSNGIARHMGTAQYAADVDLNSPAMRAYLSEMQRRRIVVDPTLAVFELEYVPESGDMSDTFAPFVGTMPPQVERFFRAGGLPPTPEVSRERMRQSQAALLNLVRELHRRRITIVAGTDGSGLELVHELELYVAAGFTPAEALASATITPSRLFGVGEETGSISVGKQAELILVEGDPSRDIGDLRNVIMVMRDGRLMQASDLRSAVGISGPPHPR